MNGMSSIKDALKNFSPNNLVYLIFPLVLLIILYASFFPFNHVLIGDSHDIQANTMYFSVVGENYFTTWNNLWAGGFPLIASPHSDKYYPLSAPFYLIFRDFFVVNFIILLHILIAYCTFFKLGSLVTRNYNVLMIFSVFFAFSGIIFGRFETGHHLLLYGIAWIPLLYYFFLKIVVFDGATTGNAVSPLGSLSPCVLHGRHLSFHLCMADHSHLLRVLYRNKTHEGKNPVLPSPFHHTDDTAFLDKIYSGSLE